MYSYLLEELSKIIGARLMVRIIYEGHTYAAEPYLVGRNHSKQDCLLAWVTSSSSSAISEDSWKTFLLNKIETIQALDDRFYNPRPGYDPYDSTMSRIYYRF